MSVGHPEGFFDGGDVHLSVRDFHKVRAGWLHVLGAPSARSAAKSSASGDSQIHTDCWLYLEYFYQACRARSPNLAAFGDFSTHVHGSFSM